MLGAVQEEMLGGVILRFESNLFTCPPIISHPFQEISGSDLRAICQPMHDPLSLDESGLGVWFVFLARITIGFKLQ